MKITFMYNYKMIHAVIADNTITVLNKDSKRTLTKVEIQNGDTRTAISKLCHLMEITSKTHLTVVIKTDTHDVLTDYNKNALIQLYKDVELVSTEFHEDATVVDAIMKSIEVIPNG